MMWILNWTWQGTLLTAAVAAALACGRRLNAATRERIWWLTLVAVLLLPFATLVVPPVAPDVRASLSSPLVVTPLGDASAWRPIWWALVWMVVAGVIAWRLARLAASLEHLQRARSSATPLPAGIEQGLRRWNALRAADAHAPRLVLADGVSHAAVLAFGSPLIAIAPGVAARLTRDELDQVVVHEYAHVRRGDALGVFVQRAIWSVAGLHPAVWWIDRALTFEREAACDDWVLAHATGAKAYGSCLIKLSQQSRSPRWSVAPGALPRSLLTRRVLRLLDPLRNGSVRRSPAALAAAALAIACGTLAGAQLRLVGLPSVPPLLRSTALGSAFSQLVAAIPASIETGPPPLQIPRASGAGSGRRSTAPAVPPSPFREIRGLLLTLDLPSEPAPDVIAHASIPLSQVSLETIGQVSTAPHIANDAPVQAAAPPDASVDAEPAGRSPWMHVADAGIAVGEQARTAGVKTGGFFTRVGRSIASAF